MLRTDAPTYLPEGCLAYPFEDEQAHSKELVMIRKLPSGKYRLYSRKKDPRSGKRRNLGTFPTRRAAEQHERAVQYFKRH